MDTEERIFKELTKEDLILLKEEAEKTFLKYFKEENTQYLDYYDFDNPYCVALCQGAAMHYYDKTNGIKDLDVWFFFNYNQKALPCRTHRENYDFYLSHNGDRINRRIDVLFRSIHIDPELSVIENMQAYLKSRRSTTPKELSKKAMVLLNPGDLFGEVIWYKGKPINPSFDTININK